MNVMPAKALGLLVVGLLLTGADQKWRHTELKGDTFSFSLPDLSGAIVTETDERFAGKVLLVDIWGTWCPPCQKALPELIAIQREHANDVAVVGIAFEEGGDEAARRKRIQKTVDAKGINFVVLNGGTTDEVTEKLPDIAAFEGFPTTIVVGRDGKVVRTLTGQGKGVSKWLNDALMTALDTP